MRKKSAVGKSKEKSDLVSSNCSTTSDYTTDTCDSTDDGADHSHYWHQEDIAPLGRKRKRNPTGPVAR